MAKVNDNLRCDLQLLLKLCVCAYANDFLNYAHQLLAKQKLEKVNCERRLKIVMQIPGKM